jgi:hypothetical protein
MLHLLQMPSAMHVSPCFFGLATSAPVPKSIVPKATFRPNAFRNSRRFKGLLIGLPSVSVTKRG